jgi:predicted ester cyclase
MKSEISLAIFYRFVCTTGKRFDKQRTGSYYYVIPNKGVDHMSIRQNKAVVRSYIVPPQGFDELNRQIREAKDPAAFIEKDSWEFLGKLFSPECIIHNPPSLGGDTSFRDFVQGNIIILTNMKDLTYSAEDLIAEGDKVVVRYTFRGIHSGPFLGVPATGKELKGSGIMICKLKGGKIIEAWVMPDILGLMQQLGIVPTMALV